MSSQMQIQGCELMDGLFSPANCPALVSFVDSVDMFFRVVSKGKEPDMLVLVEYVSSRWLMELGRICADNEFEFSIRAGIDGHLVYVHIWSVHDGIIDNVLKSRW